MYICANFGSAVVACGIWFGAKSVLGGFVALIVLYTIFFGISLVLLKQNIEQAETPISFKDAIWALTFENIFDLKELINPVVGWIPEVWCFIIKQVLPHLLFILFINLAQSKTDTGEAMFGNYGGYEMRPFQVLGILCFATGAIAFVAGLIVPQVYARLSLPDDHRGSSFTHDIMEIDHDHADAEALESNPTKYIDRSTHSSTSKQVDQEVENVITEEE